MAMLQATANALESKVHEEEIREGIDDFCGILGGIIVLCMCQFVIISPELANMHLPLHTSSALMLLVTIGLLVVWKDKV